ncbi:MAG: hypothetical protein E6I03_13645 [Chloroflexi bacterium]|nr:MAG: hypothetical protein E6I03_13645 [Chloroflexota bacterium]
MTGRSGIYLTLALATAVALTVSAVVLAPGSSSAGGNGTASAALNPADFSTNITNPLFPLSSLGPKVFEGQDTDPDTGEVIDTRLESTVLSNTRKVAGVQTLVLEEKVFNDDELVERALDFFAQHRDGTVYYFGDSGPRRKREDPCGQIQGMREVRGHESTRVAVNKRVQVVLPGRRPRPRCRR